MGVGGEFLRERVVVRGEEQTASHLLHKVPEYLTTNTVIRSTKCLSDNGHDEYCENSEKAHIKYAMLNVRN